LEAPLLESDLTALFFEKGSAEGPLNPHLPEQCFAQVAAPAPPAPAPRRKAPPDVELPSPGSILDKYRLEELVGSGAFAAVYRATHLLLQTTVAVKLLRPTAVRRVSGLAGLLCEEARYAARINHPSVVRIHDVTHTSAITYVVMEYIEGSNLSRVIKARGALPMHMLLHLGLEVVAGLKAALDQGLIHRDIKPSNILLAHTGEAKIVDLGLALPLDRKGPAARLSQLSVVGTPGYMAPEQGLAPGSVDFRADIYALGATLYHAAVGLPPFPLDDPDRCITLHRTALPPDPQSIRPGIPSGFSRLLMRMLAKSPAERPASYAQLSDELEAVLAELPPEQG
jgi:serine/threonine protein kinase